MLIQGNYPHRGDHAGLDVIEREMLKLAPILSTSPPSNAAKSSRSSLAFGCSALASTSAPSGGAADVRAECRDEILRVFEDAGMSAVQLDQLRLWHLLHQAPGDIP